MIHTKFGANWSNHQGGVRNSRFFICRDFANGKLLQKWVRPTSHNSAELREHGEISFNNVRHIMWEFWAKNALTWKIAPPAGHF